jgi:3-hydroxyacyl-CoA dehydrogenase
MALKEIRKAAVLGAGVMGATIAAHLANVGIPTYLLDIVPRELTPEEEKKGLTLESPEVRTDSLTWENRTCLRTSKNRFTATQILIWSPPATLTTIWQS